MYSNKGEEHEHRQIYKPSFRALCQQGNAVHFSQDMKFSTWRKLWIALAETEMELGLSENGKPVITQDMIDEMKEHVNDINYDVAVARENWCVMMS